MPHLRPSNAHELASLTTADEARICKNIDDYWALLKEAGPPNAHPLRAVQRMDLQPVDLNRVSIAAKRAQDAVETLARLIEAAATATKLQIEPSLATADALLDLFDRLSGLSPDEGPVASQIIRVPSNGRLAGALAKGSTWFRERRAASKAFADDAFSAPVSGIRAPIVAGTQSFLRRWSSEYRRASRALAGLLKEKIPSKAAERLALIDRLGALEETRTQWEEHEAFCSSALGEFWYGDQTDFDRAIAVAVWCSRVAESTLPIAHDWAIRLAIKSEEWKELLRMLTDARGRVLEAINAVDQLLKLDLAELKATSTNDADLRRVNALIAAIGGATDRYTEWVSVNQLRTVMGSLGVGSLVVQMEAGVLDGPRAAIELQFARAECLWRYALQSSPVLRDLRSVDRHQLTARFASLDRERLRGSVTAIRAQHLAQLPQGAAGEMRVIRGEIGKKRAHMALRRLVPSAPNAIQRIKPVLLMSPLSVAQFLPPGALAFDLLVIDEASQVRPEDALGAIARARQIAVVGDQKQLPPTSFFDRLVADENDDDDDEDPGGGDLLGGAAKVADLESILSLCEARGLSSRMLQWHYRSRDPSLILISNQEFYGHRLILPPSPLQKDPAFGMSFIRVNGVYDRGGRRNNRVEADAVVQRVAEHARDKANFSLGVATFSSAQRNLITEMLEVERRKNPALDEFLHEGKSEDVFVKNIENVQGDERDVILVSVGYGPSSPDGRLTSG